MGKETGIAWTHATFNPWRGCTKVSPGCAKCYAETLSNRNPAVLGTWGPNGTRVVAAESYWRQPLAWDKAAKAAGERRRVFASSLADVFEDWDGPMTDTTGRPLWAADVEPGRWLPWPAGGLDGMLPIERQNVERGVYRPLTMDDVRDRLFGLILATPHLDWLLLTKRPENVLRTTYDAWCPRVPGHVSQNEGDGHQWRWPDNVWLGVTAENQEQADARIPHLLKIPAAVRFLSVEPMLGPIDLERIKLKEAEHPELGQPPVTMKALSGWHGGANRPDKTRVDWVIFGGESGPDARPCDLAWIRDGVRQCREAGVACFVKQLGANVIDANDHFGGGQGDWPDDTDHGPSERYQGAPVRVRLRDKAGADPAEWPEDLRVREMPTTAGRVA